MPEYRSWSQLQDAEKCPLSYKLKRVDKVWSRPAAWLGMGTAAHEGIEVWEQSGRSMDVLTACERADEAYVREINRYLDQTPNSELWAQSGPFKGPEDILRRRDKVKEHVLAYTRYYSEEKHLGKPIWVRGVEEDEGPYGTMAVELPFSIKLGDVEVRGKIDKVEEDRVVDVKTGSSNPGDGTQLKIYALALEKQYDYRVNKGQYFLTHRGTPTRVKDLDVFSEAEITDRFGHADEVIRSEAFDAKPGDHCFRCDVNSSCPIYKELI